MARPQRPLDPSRGPVAEFAGQLRQLHQRAGAPKFLQMSRRTGRSRTALSEAVGGDHLPTWGTVVAFVTACGQDPDLWLSRWEQAKAKASPDGPAGHRTVVETGTAADTAEASDTAEAGGAEGTGADNAGRTAARVFASSRSAVVGRRDVLWLGGGAVVGVLGALGWGSARAHHVEREAHRSVPRTAGRGRLVEFSRFSAFVVGDLVVAGGDRTAEVWLTGDLTLVSRLDTRAEAVVAVGFDPLDRNVVATVAPDGLVRIFDVATQRPILAIESHRVGHPAVIAFDPLLRDEIAVGGAGGTVAVWNVRLDQRVVDVATGNGQVTALAHDPHCTGQLAVAGDRSVLVHDRHTGRRMSTLSNVTLPLRALAFDPLTRNTLAAVTSDGHPGLWDSATGHPVRQLTTADVTALVFNPQIRNSLATADGSGRIQIWDASTGASIHTLRRTGPAPTSLAYSPDGRTLAVGSAAADVELWPIEDW